MQTVNSFQVSQRKPPKFPQAQTIVQRSPSFNLSQVARVHIVCQLQEIQALRSSGYKSSRPQPILNSNTILMVLVELQGPLPSVPFLQAHCFCLLWYFFLMSRCSPPRFSTLYACLFYYLAMHLVYGKRPANMIFPKDLAYMGK